MADAVSAAVPKPARRPEDDDSNAQAAGAAGPALSADARSAEDVVPRSGAIEQTSAGSQSNEAPASPPVSGAQSGAAELAGTVVQPGVAAKVQSWWRRLFASKSAAPVVDLGGADTDSSSSQVAQGSSDSTPSSPSASQSSSSSQSTQSAQSSDASPRVELAAVSGGPAEATRVDAPTPPTDVRRLFRDLFNQEITARGGQPIVAGADPSDAPATEGTNYSSALLGLLGLGLGGGGGGGAAAAAGGSPIVAALSGTVVKGYLNRAVVWRDSNSNGRFDWTDANRDGVVQESEVSGDDFVYTDSSGRFTGLKGQGAVYVFGGTDDLGTGERFAGLLSAPSSSAGGSLVVTPLTTIIQSYSTSQAFQAVLAAQSGASSLTDEQKLALAATKIRDALGLPGTVDAKDLLGTDPIQVALDSDPSTDSAEALRIYAKAAQVANLLVTATAAVVQARGDAGSSAAPNAALADVNAASVSAATVAIDSLVASVGNKISAGATVDLGSSAFLGQVFTEVSTKLTAAGKSLSSVGSVSDLASAVANVNSYFGNIAESADTTRVALTALVQTEYIVQNDLTSEGILKGSFQAAQFANASLDARFDEAISVVGPIAAPQTGQRRAPGKPVLVDPAPEGASSAIEYLNATEMQTANIRVASSLADTGAQAGDTVRFYLSGEGSVQFEGRSISREVASVVLTSADITAGKVNASFVTSRLSEFAQNQGLSLSAQVQATATGASGTEGIYSRGLPIVVDTTVASPVLRFGASDDTGSSATDGITKVAAPVLQVTGAELGASLTYSVARVQGNSEVAIGQPATVKAGSSVSIDLSKVIAADSSADGTYVVRASQTDLAGNVSTQSSYQFTLDRAAPVLTLNNAAVALNASTASAFARNITVQGADSVVVDVLNSQGQKVSVPGLGIANGVLAGNFGSLATDGNYTLKVTASDLAGNVTSSSIDMLLDRVSPNFVSFAAAQGQASAFNPNAISQDGFTFTGSVQGLDAGKPVTVEVLGSDNSVKLSAAPTVTNAGAFSARFNATQLQSLLDGDYTVRARASDDAGNSASSAGSVALSVDRDAPQAGLVPLNKTALSLAAAQTYSQTLSVEAGSTVSAKVYAANGSTVLATLAVADAGQGSKLLSGNLGSLGNGDYRVVVTATDAAGNATTQTQAFSIDAQAPTVSFAQVAGDGFVNALELADRPLLSGTASVEDGQPITLTLTRSGQAQAVTLTGNVSGGAFAFELPVNLADGVWSVATTVTDFAGNAPTGSTSTQFTVSTAALPVPTITLATDTGVAGDKVTSSGTLTIALDTRTVAWQISTDGGQTYSVPPTAVSGSVFTPSIALAAGNYESGSIKVRAIDAAGNTSVATVTDTYKIDTAAPVALSILGSGDATYSLGSTITFLLSADEPMYVTGAPRLKLALESLTSRYATYVSGSGTSTLVFSYTVQSGDLDSNGVGISSMQYSYTGAPVGTQITDLAGNVLQNAAGYAFATSLPSIANQNLTGVRVNGAVIGTAVDGYLVNVLIFADANNDNEIDAGEAVGGSVGPGVFAVPGGSGPLVMRGGEDISTGQPFSVQYEAPEGYLVINPITTLIAQVQKAGGVSRHYKIDSANDDAEIPVTNPANYGDAGVFVSFNTSTSSAQASVLTGLGLTAGNNINFASYDAFREASRAITEYAGADLAAKTVAAKSAKLAAVIYQKTAAMLATLSDVGGEILASVDTTTASPGSQIDTTVTSIAVMKSVASTMLAKNASGSLAAVLTNSTEIAGILNNAATALSSQGVSLDSSRVGSIASVLAKANQIIWGQDVAAISIDTDGRDAAKDSVSVLRKIVAVQQVVQGDDVIALLELKAKGIANTSGTNPVSVDSAITTLLNDSSASGLKLLAENAIVGPIVPSRFAISYAAPAAEVSQVAGGVPFAYEGNAEGGDRVVSFVVKRSGGLDGTVVLGYSITGSATLTGDRFVGGALPSGSVSFAADETEKTISFRVANNSVRNPSELLTLTLKDLYGNSQFADSQEKSSRKKGGNKKKSKKQNHIL